MSRDDRTRSLARLAAQVQSSGGEKTAALAVIDHALELVPDADWVSLTVRARRGRFLTLAASDDVARKVDELQYGLREGPCVEAAGGADWYRSGSVATDVRWPHWGPQAAGLGIGSLLSVRLSTEEGPLGALNMYARREGRFNDHDEVDFALLYGAHAAVSLTSAREIDGLRNAISSRHVIGLAQGMVMERFGLSVERSFDLLRRYSSQTNVKLAEIAAEIVATRELPMTGVDDEDQ